jgi:hypothetical protein
MVRLNKIVRALTFEGARAKRFTPEMALKRALMNCLLWENQFYEDGVAIAERIKALVPQVEPARVAALAIEAREVMKLRHAPLLVIREMARHEKHRVLVADTLARVIQRPDEMTELLAIYWADALGPKQQRKRQPVSAQVKKGLRARSPSSTPISLRSTTATARCGSGTSCSWSTPSRRTRTRRRCGSSSSTANWLLPTPGRFRSRPARTSARPSSG